MILFFRPILSSLFSTKSAHHLLTSARSPIISPLPTTTWKALWKLNLNHRLRLFLWKMDWNIIPTKTHIYFLFHPLFPK
jgi:hypothetical protein